MTSSPRNGWKKPRTIRLQITLTVWTLLAISFGISNILLLGAATKSLVSDIQNQLEDESKYLSFSIERWQYEIKTTLELLADTPTIKYQRTEDFTSLLNAASSAYPEREWRIRDRSGNLLAHTGPQLSHQQSPQIFRQRYQNALAGKFDLQVGSSPMLRRACLIGSTPYYAARQVSSPRDAAGVISFCLRLSDLGKDSGMKKLEETVNHLSEGTRGGDLLDLSKNDYSGRAFFLVDKQGHLLFPARKEMDALSLQPWEAILKGPWGPLVKLTEGKNIQAFDQLSINNHTLFALIRDIPGGQWTSVNVIDKDTVFRKLYANLRYLIFLQLLTLVAVTWATFLVCKKIADPLHLAGQALRQIRQGIFNLHLPKGKPDEMGELINDINETAKELEALLASKMQSALTEQQVATARRIHQDFLVKEVPNSETYDMAVFTAPALDVGADWYDAMQIGNTLFVVIADVCDKGVGSALYMSVFRSLLRYSLQRFAQESLNDHQQLLGAVATLVNNYMAENHGLSAMFATVFLGAFDTDTNRLTYLTAGHECPFILREGYLDQLEVTGPAIGIFAGASFHSKVCQLQSGDLLFAYTDGLPDARSPEGIGWGVEPLKKLLLNSDRSSITAQTMTDTVVEQIRYHVGSADAFDDLTLLALHVPANHA